MIQEEFRLRTLNRIETIEFKLLSFGMEIHRLEIYTLILNINPFSAS